MIHLNKPYIVRQDMDSVLTSLVIEDFEKGGILGSLCSELQTLIPARYVYARSHGHEALYQLLSHLRGRSPVIVLNPLQPNSYARYAADLGLDIHWTDIDENGCSQVTDIPDGSIVVLDYPFSRRSEIDRDDLESCIVIEDISSVFTEDPEYNAGFTGDYLLLQTGSRNIITTGQGGFIFSREELAIESSLSDINASLALSQLQNLAENCRRRRTQFARFRASLSRGRHTTVSLNEKEVSRCFLVFADRASSEIIGYARKQGVETELFFHVERDGDLIDFASHPQASSLMRRVICFPLYPSLKKNEIEKISKVLTTLP